MPDPLPTLYKALPGYQCCAPACIQALQALDETTVVCPLGHTFPRDQPAMEATQQLEPTEEPEDDAG